MAKSGRVNKGPDVFRNPDGSGIQVVHRADWQEAAAGRTVRRFAYGEIRCQHVGCKQVFWNYCFCSSRFAIW